MRINKKLIILMMTIVIGGTLAGCGKKSEEPAPIQTPVIVETPNGAEVPGPVETPLVENEEQSSEQKLEEVTGEQDPTVSTEMIFMMTDGLEMPAQMAMDETMFADTYGIDTNLLASYTVNMPLMAVHATEVAVFELKDAKNAEAIMAGIEKRQKALEDQWQSYLPEQLELVQNYKTAVQGNFVLFVISEHANQIVENFKSVA